jgi:cytochrome b subunit of formate dehydrogenase
MADTANADAPSCVTCHPSHGPALSVAAARREATARCVECHSNNELARRYDLPSMAGRSYADDFHGRTMEFQARIETDEAPPDVLICSDCHGAHDVTWVDRGDMAAVCLRCHETADVRIAGAWLGHQPVSPRNGIVVWAIRLFYYVFIPFVLGGLLIHILFDIRHQLRRRGAREHGGADARIMVARFTLIERLEHLLSMVTFTLLVVTGLPQAWPASSAGNRLIHLFGGIASTRLVHRMVGVIFVTLLVLHIGRAVYGILRHRRLPVMFATRADFRAVSQTVRHLLGRGPAPKVGKFDFREKFEYWGLFLGGTLMTVTGLLLMFVDDASRLLPGVLLAGARVMHGLEATFAVLVVLLWHTWGVILRPEVFPVDTSIFTGKISLHRLKEEHGLEYERIYGTGVPSEGREAEGPRD